MKKRLLFSVIVLIASLSGLSAQEQRGQRLQRFSPEQFDAELQQFIIHEACLSPKEAAAFFPIYREMQKKQRVIFERQKQQGKIKPADEKYCEKAIKMRDENELELKRIQQTYHNKMLSVVSASKLYDIIHAEDRFHRQKIKNWGQRKEKK